MYDVFISYRRDGGEFIGKLIYDRLKSEGYTCFYDVETMRSGKFNEQLYSVIQECTDVLVILSPDALDRCSSETDWVRKEITHAIKHNKNIIPIMLRNFEWPKDLPSDIEELPNYEGLRASTEDFDSKMKKLTSFLHSKKTQSKDNWKVNCDEILNFGIIDSLLGKVNEGLKKIDKILNIDIQILIENLSGIYRFYFELNRDKSIEGYIRERLDYTLLEVKKTSNIDLRKSKIECSIYASMLELDNNLLHMLTKLFKVLYGMRQVYYSFSRDKNLDTCKILETNFTKFTYEDKSYLMKDIFYATENKKVAYAITEEFSGKLPEVAFFEVDSGENQLYRISQNTEEYLTILMHYAILIRGMFIPTITFDCFFNSISTVMGDLTKEFYSIKYLSYIYECLSFDDLHYAVPVKNFFGNTKYFECKINERTCCVFNSNNYKTKRISPFRDLTILDMVKVKIPTNDIRTAFNAKQAMYIFLCLKYNENKKCNEFAVYAATIENDSVTLLTNGAFNRRLPKGSIPSQLDITQCYREDIAERFALRAELIKKFNLSDIRYIYPKKLY